MTSSTREQRLGGGRVASQRATPAPYSRGGAGLFTLLWLTFLGVLIVAPEQLDATWSWFRDLPTIAQIVGWVLLLPLVLGLWIWQAPLALWVRVSLIVLLAMANVITVSRPSRPRTA